MVTSYAHHAEKTVSVHYTRGSVWAERVGQGEVGGATCRVTCTWWLLGLAVKVPWLGLVSCPGSPCTGEKEGLVFWTTFLVTLGGIAIYVHDVSKCILNRIGGKKTYLAARSQLSQDTLQPYQVSLNHTVQQFKSSENLSPRCKMQIWYSLRCRPHPMWQGCWLLHAR